MTYSQALEEQVSRLRAIESMPEPNDPGTREWLDQAHYMLAEAETYYWAPGVCRIIEDVHPTIPDNWIINRERLPSPAGFCWLASPDGIGGGFSPERKSLLGLSMHDYAIQAFGWRAVKSFHDPEGEFTGSSGVVIVGFGLMETDTRQQPIVVAGARDGWSVGTAESYLRTNLAPDMQALRAVTILVFAAAMGFLEQRILIAPRQRAERHARRRLAQGGYRHEPLIRVVELRRTQSRPNHGGEHDAVNWACQWVVSGHWRQQWYPSLNAYQPRWIMPYVKGPEDKPLKPPRAKVFAVVR